MIWIGAVIVTTLARRRTAGAVRHANVFVPEVDHATVTENPLVSLTPFPPPRTKSNQTQPVCTPLPSR